MQSALAAGVVIGIAAVFSAGRYPWPFALIGLVWLVATVVRVRAAAVAPVPEPEPAQPEVLTPGSPEAEALAPEPGVAAGDGSAFYNAELADRQRFHAPPFGRLVKLTVSLEDRDAAEKKADAMAAELRERATAAGTHIEVLGPLPAYIARRAGKWRFHVVLRGDDPMTILGGDPGVPWSVDVDPESLL